MSSAASQNYISSTTLRSTSISMIIITTAFYSARTIARCRQRGPRFQAEDYFMALAFIFYMAMTIAYLVIIDPMYRATNVQAGKAPPYATILDDVSLMTKTFFCTTMLLWFTLWSVKLAFLFLYRRLMLGLPHYLRWWWAILGFSIVVRVGVATVRRCIANDVQTLIGAVISNFTSCASMHEWFTPGQCSSRRDEIAQIASLYYAFAVDIVSDLMSKCASLIFWTLLIYRSHDIASSISVEPEGPLLRADRYYSDLWSGTALRRSGYRSSSFSRLQSRLKHSEFVMVSALGSDRGSNR